ncbi:MAG TPA: hypothetical protein VNO31_31780 [Umezawaea sp.]|nr:hypothetical protein [Umezawaea sp.]
MPFNDTAKNLAFSAGITNTTSGIKFIGVGVAGDPGTATTLTGTEATGGSPAYARVAVAWSAAASGQQANSGALTIDVPAGTYSDLLFFNAGTGNAVGNYLGYAPINGSTKGFGTVDAAGVTSDTITSAAHGLANTNQVRVYNVFAESLPTGFTEGTTYFVVGSTTDTFQLSTTSGGSAVNITAIGELYFQRVIPEVFASQGQVTVAIGALVLDATAI